MKNKYTKPVLMMEDFTLSQSIAHNCGKALDFNQATLKYKSTCGWDLGTDGEFKKGGLDILWTGSPNCSIPTGEEAGVVCYNNPGGGFNVFNS
ncbi:MAG: hypothetical protein IJX71_01650 [Oscillospiraceae bacterium]|nr:hypothetical protein [Oscillospiraceae bacterium]